MSNKIGLKILLSSILIGLNNLITYISEGQTNIVTLFMYVIIFFLIPIPIFLFGRKKLNHKFNAVIFAIVGIITIFIGDIGNSTGIIYICFYYYIYHDRNKNIYIIAALLCSVMFKYFYLGFSFSQGMNLLISYFFIFSVYYDLIHPKKPEILLNNWESINEKKKEKWKEILLSLIDGLDANDISEEMGFSDSDIRRQIRSMIEYFGCKTQNQLIYKLTKTGIICHIVDKNNI